MAKAASRHARSRCNCCQPCCMQHVPAGLTLSNGRCLCWHSVEPGPTAGGACHVIPKLAWLVPNAGTLLTCLLSTAGSISSLGDDGLLRWLSA